MNARQLEILQHALGVDKYGQGEMYRNHFCAGVDDEATCRELVEMGYMETFTRKWLPFDSPLRSLRTLKSCRNQLWRQRRKRICGNPATCPTEITNGGYDALRPAATNHRDADLLDRTNRRRTTVPRRLRQVDRHASAGIGGNDAGRSDGPACRYIRRRTDGATGSATTRAHQALAATQERRRRGQAVTRFRDALLVTLLPFGVNCLVMWLVWR